MTRAIKTPLAPTCCRGLLYINQKVLYIDNQTYYVFLLNGIESKSELAGYMPLKSQYGFIYSGNIDTRTIAHELAHVQRIKDIGLVKNLPLNTEQKVHKKR